MFMVRGGTKDLRLAYYIWLYFDVLNKRCYKVARGYLGWFRVTNKSAIGASSRKAQLIYKDHRN
jgi:hypothetical protein